MLFLDNICPHAQVVKRVSTNLFLDTTKYIEFYK